MLIQSANAFIESVKRNSNLPTQTSNPLISRPLTAAQVIAIVDAAVADASDEAIENARAVLFDLNHADDCPLSHILDVS